jgi:hypothetical protein
LRLTFLSSIVSGRTEQEIRTRKQGIEAGGTVIAGIGAGIRNKKLGTEQKEENLKIFINMEQAKIRVSAI